MSDYCRVCNDARADGKAGEYREASVPIDRPQKETRKQHYFQVFVCIDCLES